MASLSPETSLYLANFLLRRSVVGTGISLVTTRPIAKPEHRVEFALEIHQRAPHLRFDQRLTFGPLGTIMELSERELEQWDGYELEVFGGPVDSSTPDDGHTWVIKWAEEDARAPLKLRLDRQWVHYKDSPVRGELLRIPSQPDQRSIQWLDERSPSDIDLTRARDGLALLDGLPRIIRGTGRPRLEAAPRSDTLALARQAKTLLAEGRYARLTDIAEYLGMVTTDEEILGENPRDHRKAIRAAAERLRRGLARLNEIGDT